MSRSAIVAFAVFAACGAALAQDTAPLQAEAAELTKQYATRLMSALQAAIAKSGPEGAVEVCHDQAPVIAADLSRSSGWTISRTSLKPRNAASAPDVYERAAMTTFEARIGKGEKAADLAVAGVVDDKDGKMFRFVKAIPTAPLCLACHGPDVAPELKRKIDALYPNDMATGFKLGDMRGAFTLKKRLD